MNDSLERSPSAPTARWSSPRAMTRRRGSGTRRTESPSGSRCRIKGVSVPWRSGLTAGPCSPGALTARRRSASSTTPPPEPSDLAQRAERYATEQGRGGVRRGRSPATRRALRRGGPPFEKSLAVQPDWPNYGRNAYGLALTHHRLGHPDEARPWLGIAGLARSTGRTYAVVAPDILTGQPQVPVSFEFWVYAQVLRREAAGPILDTSFPTDSFAMISVSKDPVASSLAQTDRKIKPSRHRPRGRVFRTDSVASSGGKA